MPKLEGKRALVTGAAGGIGYAIARLCAAGGALVIAADIDDAVHELANVDGIHTANVDVSDEAAVEGLVGDGCDRFGGIDWMFANAGIVGSMAPLLELDAAEWRRVLDVNLLGVFFAIKHAARRMQAAASGGSIVCTASVAGLRSGAGPAPYSASKAAIVNLVATAACQLGGSGIRVNAVCPGLIETPMTRPIFELAREAGKLDKIGQLNPLRRAGQPDEVARLAVFLASDDASYINGQALVVDGGLSSSHPFIPGKMW